MTPISAEPRDRGRLSGLQFRLSLIDGIPSLRPFVDGIDFLSNYINATGRDPNTLLPPLSDVLLPTRLGRPAIVGVCSCGEAECGSLEVLIRRDRGVVIWGPVNSPRDETPSRSHRFGLEQYLNAVDDAVQDRPGEGRGRAVARIVRQMIGQCDGRYEALTAFHSAKIDWVSAWPWGSELVQASLSTAAGQQILKFNANYGESDEQFAARVARDLLGRRMASAEDIRSDQDDHLSL